MTRRKTYTVEQCRDYMTNLMKRRSIVALCAGVLTVMLSFYGIIAGVNKTIAVLGKNGFTSFIYFTMISNTLASLSSAFMIPFAVEGIRKKRFTLPRWIAVMHYSATVSITIMFLFVMCFMSWISPNDAFGGVNIVTHIFCPFLILISFFQTENGYIYKVKDQFVGMIPFFLYMIIYFVEVILVGEANGGWPDIYYTNVYIPFWITVIVMLLLAFGISFAVRIISNHMTIVRRRRMFSFWNDDADPIELRIEAYALGVMIGMREEKNNINIPYDILEYFAGKYKLNVDDLTGPFMKGILNGLKEKNRPDTVIE